MERFKAIGPFKIPIEQRAAGRLISRDQSGFWKDHPQIAKSRGIYVFGIRAGKGIVPMYIGLTKRTFEDECFTYHKLAQHYDMALADYKSGTPGMFFLVKPITRGKPNLKILREIEKFMIDVGTIRNSELSNIQGNQQPNWGIVGVLRGGKGKVSTSATAFKTMMGLD